MKCEHLNSGICTIATRLAGKDVFPILSQCEYCTNQAEPKQSINTITVSLAVKWSTDRARVIKSYGHFLRQVATSEPHGPGTELKKLISWFYVPDDSKCKCKDRINKMNRWGPDKCEENIDTIMRWLKHSATINSVPYVESAVRVLVWVAIRKARKNVR